MTHSFFPKPVDSSRLSLKTFSDVASAGGALQVSHNGSDWTIGLSDEYPLEPGGSRAESDVDTTSIFIEVLGKTYSRGIQETVVRELGLQANPGQPLQLRLVRQAIAMAEVSQQALQGVDFMTRLTFSAAAHAVGFVDTCRSLGVSPDTFSAPQRTAIDASLLQRFVTAASQRQSPVAPGGARQWLHAELAAVNVKIPGER